MKNDAVTGTKPEISEKIQNNPKQLSNFMIMVFVALIASFPPLSTDLYLPALPTMSAQLDCSAWWVNLSIVVFFIFVSASSFLWGPFSDKYGRKRMLLIGVPLFILSSIFCMLSQNVYQLIAARILQAIGAGAAMAVNLAIVKDVFPGKKRESTLAMAAVLNGMIPVIAPSIGSLIIRFSSWQGIFGLLVITGVFVLIFVLFLKETNKDFSVESTYKTVLRLGVVFLNPNFYRLVIVFSIVSIPLLAFIGVSSFIFIQRFGLSAEVYSIYFGAIAAHYIIGGPIYLVLQKFFRPMTIITVSYIGSIISGALMLTIGQTSPNLFAVSVALGYLCVSISRPPSNSLLLEQQDKDTGSASSLIQATFVLTGSLGMMIISYDWSNRVMVIGIMNVVLSSIGFLLWQYSKTRCRIPRHFLK
ncbi:MAG: multidrug effflux MFS transporter [Desulfobacteraceae bacterium]|jgi:DHA1 family bicyclomycin/chloramphenicol resistance-like MFS transporter